MKNIQEQITELSKLLDEYKIGKKGKWGSCDAFEMSVKVMEIVELQQQLILELYKFIKGGLEMKNADTYKTKEDDKIILELGDKWEWGEHIKYSSVQILNGYYTFRTKVQKKKEVKKEVIPSNELDW